MSQALAQPSDCCAVCPEVPITQVPGPAGDDGAAGAAGTNGLNAYTTTTAGFTMPAVSSNVSVAVVASAWATVGQVVFVQGAGHFTVNSVPDATHLSLTNLGYAGNAAPTTPIAGSQNVSPAGLKGVDGSSGTPPTLNSLSPTNLKGDLIVDTGALNPAADDVRFSRGTDGQLLSSVAAQPVGLLWQTLLPNAATDNVLPRYDASGTTTPTPLQSSAMRLTDNGALQETGGNAKGTDAVDLQPIRGAATQVASGNNAFLAGKNSTASGASSVALGEGNVASGANSVALGTSNTASTNNATVSGGSTNTASAINSTVAGGNANTATVQGATVGGGEVNTASGQDSVVAGGATNIASSQHSSVGGGTINSATTEQGTCVPGGIQAKASLHAQMAHSAGAFALQGDAQTSELIWRVTTTDATAGVEAFLNGVTATKRATVPNNTTWAFEVICAARRSDGMSICFKVDGGIKNDAGTVALVAAVTTVVTADGTAAALGAANFVVSADDPNNSLKVAVTGQVGQTWRWVARARLIEVGH